MSVKENVIETMNSFVDYWDANNMIGISVAEFMALVEKVDPKYGNEAFQLVKQSFAPVNDEEVDQLIAETTEKIKRELHKNFPSDEDFAKLTSDMGIQILEGASMVLRPTYGTLEEGAVPLLVSKKALKRAIADYESNSEQPGYMPIADVMPDMAKYFSGAREGKHIVRFKPKYRIETIDKYLVRALDPNVYKRSKYPRALVQLMYSSVKWLRSKVLEAGAKYVLANGDAQSQLGRYLRNLGIRESLIGRSIRDDPLVELQLPAFVDSRVKQAMLQRMNELYPMRSVPALDGVSIFGTETEENSLLEAAAAREAFDGHRLLVFQKKSSVSVMFPENTDEIKNLKNGNVQIQNILLGEMVLQHMGFEGESFKSTLAIARVAQMKSKWEIIDAVKNVERVRNIMNANTFAQLPMSMLCRNTSMLNMVQEWEVAREFFLEARTNQEKVKVLKMVTSRHILGFTPFKGGLNALFEYLEYWVRYVGTDILFTYADNLYGMVRAGHVWKWLSADGKSFEVQNIRENAESFATRLANANQLGPKWRKYATEFWPWASIDAIGVLGKEQFPVPGLSSGTAATAYCNTERMLYLIAYLDVMYNNGYKVLDVNDDFHPEFKQALKAVKLELEITQVTRWDFTNTPATLTLDLLGYDCMKVKIGLEYVYVPFLTEDRVVRAVAFNKSTAVKTDLTNDELMVMRLMKYSLLYYIGGWVNETLSFALTMLCRYTLSRISDSYDLSLISEVYAELESTANVDLSSLDYDFNRPAVPSPYDCMRFAVGEEKADLWMRDLVQRGVDVILPLAGFKPEDVVNYDNEIRPPSIPDVLLAEALVPVSSLDDTLTIAEIKELSEVAAKESAPLRVTAARNHVLRGAMGALERYHKQTDKEKESAIAKMIHRLDWPKNFDPARLAYLSPATDRKTRLYDIAAVLSAVSGANIFNVVDYLRENNFDPTKYPMISKEQALHWKLRYIADAFRRSGVGSGAAGAKVFLSENIDEYKRILEGDDASWNFITELNELEAPEIRALVKAVADMGLSTHIINKYSEHMSGDDDDMDDDVVMTMPRYPPPSVPSGVQDRRVRPTVPAKKKGHPKSVKIIDNSMKYNSDR